MLKSDEQIKNIHISVWCIWQIMWLLVTTCLVGSLPDGSFKRWIVRRTYIIAFRIMARSLSGVIRIHNKEYSPRKNGVCVSNHTTPVDILILSTDNDFSLVSFTGVISGSVGELLFCIVFLKRNGIIINVLLLNSNGICLNVPHV